MYKADEDRLALVLQMDAFWDETTPTRVLEDAFESSSWRLQQGALLAAGDRALRDAVPAIVKLLDLQDSLDVCGAGDEWSFDGAKDENQQETWKCRFRVKQAACVALGKIAQQHGPEVLGTAAMSKLKKYAVSQEDDYAVRAVACEALGRTRDKSAVSCLEKATTDGEWCTKTQAQMALNLIGED